MTQVPSSTGCSGDSSALIESIEGRQQPAGITLAIGIVKKGSAQAEIVVTPEQRELARRFMRAMLLERSDNWILQDLILSRIVLTESKIRVAEEEVMRERET